MIQEKLCQKIDGIYVSQFTNQSKKIIKQQLSQLLRPDGVKGIEINFARTMEHRTQILDDIISDANECHAKM